MFILKLSGIQIVLCINDKTEQLHVTKTRRKVNIHLYFHQNR